MRGKNIIWLGLIAIMVLMPLSNVGFTESVATMYVDPALSTGAVPPDTFDVNIKITSIDLLYAWQVGMKYPPAQTMMSVITVVPGDFWTEDIVFNVDTFDGTLWVGSSLAGNIDGISGEGTLATVTFALLEAGEATLDLHDGRVTLYEMDGDMEREDVDTVDGYWLGPTADLHNVPTAKANGLNQKNWRVGDTRKLKAIGENTGYAPLWMRGKFTTVRDDAATFVLYSGQHFITETTQRTEYLYVNEFFPLYGGWALFGSSPYLDAIEDGSYVSGTAHCQLSDGFGFDDVSLGPFDKIVNVELEGYTQADSTDMDYDVLVWDSMAWLGSLWGNPTYEWKSPRWVGADTVSDIAPQTKTLAGLNGFEVLLHAYYPLTYGNLDAMRLKVTIETGGIYNDPYDSYLLVQPGETRNMAHATWDLESVDGGHTYLTTVEIEYQYYTPDPRFPQTQQTGSSVVTFSWQVP